MRKPSRSERVGVLVILIALMAMLLSGPILRHHLHSCALCRLNRSDYRCFGLTWSDINETECSEWYRGHVETKHEHLWIPARSGSMRNAFGTPYGAWDNAKDRGVFRLHPQHQIKV